MKILKKRVKRSQQGAKQELDALEAEKSKKVFMTTPEEKSSPALEQWTKLLCCILIILFFMFGIAPVMEKMPLIQPIIRFIDDRGIDASALYYTEIEEFSVADINMNNTMDYPPETVLRNLPE